MYEWDENKREINLVKHKIDFIDAVDIFNSEYIETRLVRNEEVRFCVTGKINNVVCSLVYTLRGNKKRIISVRPASKKERKDYEEVI